ncbi:hypothetical protein TNIN_102231 [Trichonephila inaurata madagascariensis]|uniref:Uncharacterized protein n=1 Tax=Trichonephila inaurata madagascariensis TaxID=2747483 RepID=A0A8X6XDE9_9ARAC|nr:hypothetical protein TNIN_102231 [Trichonephila inaurata madagascariensis]
MQTKAAKIILGTISLTKYLKAQWECGLPALLQRRKYLTIKFTNKANSRYTEHISKRTPGSWNRNSSYKRSSTLTYYDEINKELKLKKVLFLHYATTNPLFFLVFQPTPKSFLIWLNTARKRELQMLLKPKDSKQSRQVPTTNLSKFIQMKPSSDFALYF